VKPGATLLDDVWSGDEACEDVVVRRSRSRSFHCNRSRKNRMSGSPARSSACSEESVATQHEQDAAQPDGAREEELAATRSNTGSDQSVPTQTEEDACEPEQAPTEELATMDSGEAMQLGEEIEYAKEASAEAALVGDGQAIVDSAHPPEAADQHAIVTGEQSFVESIWEVVNHVVDEASAGAQKTCVEPAIMTDSHTAAESAGAHEACGEYAIVADKHAICENASEVRDDVMCKEIAGAQMASAETAIMKDGQTTAESSGAHEALGERAIVAREHAICENAGEVRDGAICEEIAGAQVAPGEDALMRDGAAAKSAGAHEAIGDYAIVGGAHAICEKAGEVRDGAICEDIVGAQVAPAEDALMRDGAAAESAGAHEAIGDYAIVGGEHAICEKPGEVRDNAKCEGIADAQLASADTAIVRDDQAFGDSVCTREVAGEPTNMTGDQAVVESVKEVLDDVACAPLFGCSGDVASDVVLGSAGGDAASEAVNEDSMNVCTLTMCRPASEVSQVAASVPIVPVAVELPPAVDPPCAVPSSPAQPVKRRRLGRKTSPRSALSTHGVVCRPVTVSRAESPASTPSSAKRAGLEPASDYSSSKSGARRRRSKVAAGPSTSRDSDFSLKAAGHTLRPDQLGCTVSVVGDGWGGGGEAVSYQAVVLEADDHTFTVVAVSGDEQWKEMHVLREHCISVDDASSGCVGQSSRLKKLIGPKASAKRRK